MKEYKKYVLGGAVACFMAVALMTPIEKSEAFWPFSKAKKENNASYTGAVANAERTKIKPAPSITVVSPNGGETLQAGKSYTIKWKSKGISKKSMVRITLEEIRGDAFTQYPIATTTNKGSYKWLVPKDKSGNAFRVFVNTDNPYYSDGSDGFFSIKNDNENLLRVIPGEQPLSSLFPKKSALPFNNFIVDPQGKQITLDGVTISLNKLPKLPYDVDFEVMLVIKKFNGGDKESADFYEGKTIAIGRLNRANQLSLIPNMANFAFNYPVEFSVVGVRGSYTEDYLKDGDVLSMDIGWVEATDLKTGNSLIATDLPIEGVNHTVDNSLKVGNLLYQELTDLSNEGYIQMELPLVSSDKAILKNLYLDFGSNWDVNKETVVTVKNNSNNNVKSFVCSGVFNGMVKCSFGKSFLMDRGVSFHITVNQEGGISSLKWFDLIANGYAYEYRLYPETARACFLAGTKIDMADGTKKNIEEIKVGDYVKSLNTETKKTNNAKVVKVIKKIDPSHLTINGLLKTVPDQKMFTKEGFKQAQNLKIGDYLLDNSNNWIKISDISPVVYESVETYDLVLDGGNTFYADGYLAHSVEE